MFGDLDVQSLDAYPHVHCPGPAITFLRLARLTLSSTDPRVQTSAKQYIFCPNLLSYSALPAFPGRFQDAFRSPASQIVENKKKATLVLIAPA